MRTLLILSLLAVAGAASASKPDPGNGALVFDESCGECHSVSPAKRNKKGPTLFDVINRPAAEVPDFKYSEALKSAHFTWTPEKLDAYIRDPKHAVPGGKMKFDGLEDPNERADLLAFLASKH